MDLRFAQGFAVTPLDLSNLVPHLLGAWATGLIWVAIQLGRGAWHGRLSFRSARVTAAQGASCACALSVCAMAAAAYSNNLISHGVEGLIIVSQWAAMASAATACDGVTPELEFRGGDPSGSSDSDSGS